MHEPEYLEVGTVEEEGTGDTESSEVTAEESIEETVETEEDGSDEILVETEEVGEEAEELPAVKEEEPEPLMHGLQKDKDGDYRYCFNDYGTVQIGKVEADNRVYLATETDDDEERERLLTVKLVDWEGDRYYTNETGKSVKGWQKLDDANHIATNISSGAEILPNLIVEE